MNFVMNKRTKEKKTMEKAKKALARTGFEPVTAGLQALPSTH